MIDLIMEYAKNGQFTSTNLLKDHPELNRANTTKRLKKLCDQGRLQRTKAGSRTFVYSIPASEGSA